MIKIIDEKKAINTLKKSDLVILPTDTVYGIMAKFNRKNEIKINEFKDSDINKKISVIFYNKKELFKYIENISFFRKVLIRLLLPGKYTFIVNLKKEFVLENGFTRNDFGVRITKCKELQNIIKKTGPLLATSCNKSNEKVCTSIKDIEKEINKDISVYYTKELKNKPSKILNLTLKKIKVIR